MAVCGRLKGEKMTKTKNNFLIKMLVAVAFVLSAICMTACAKTNKNISSISVVGDTVPLEIAVGQFNQAGIKIKVEYEDGSSAVVSVTTDMLDESAKNLVNTKSGSYVLTIKFRGKETKISVNIVEAKTVHTVKFYNALGQMIYRDDNVKNGESSTLPTTELIQCEGYTFVEWDRATDNVTGDINVYGVYYRIDETVTSAVMEAKFNEVYENYIKSNHTASYNKKEYNSGTLRNNGIGRLNYHYTSPSEFESQMIINNIEEGNVVKDSSVLKFNVKNGDLGTCMFVKSENGEWVEEECDYSNVEAEKTYWLEKGSNRTFEEMVCAAIYIPELSELRGTDVTKTYSYKRYTNGKTIYMVTFDEINDSGAKYEKTIVEYNDEHILSINKTSTISGQMNYELKVYFDYVEKPFEDMGITVTSKDTLVSNAKSLINSLLDTDHTLKTESEEVFTYDSTTHNYKNSDSSIELPFINKFNGSIDSLIYIYSSLYDATENIAQISIGLNDKLYQGAEELRIFFTNNKITKIEYFVPNDDPSQMAPKMDYTLTVVYAE